MSTSLSLTSILNHSKEQITPFKKHKSRFRIATIFNHQKTKTIDLKVNKCAAFPTPFCFLILFTLSCKYFEFVCLPIRSVAGSGGFADFVQRNNQKCFQVNVSKIQYNKLNVGIFFVIIVSEPFQYPIVAFRLSTFTFPFLYVKIRSAHSHGVD